MPNSDKVNDNWWWAFVGAAVIVALDQVTKYFATAELLDGAIPVLPFLTFRYLCNTGAAFSILQGYTHFLTIVGVVFVIYFSWEIWRLRSASNPPVLYAVALTMILAGAGGNLIDRATQGCVVDFIHVHYGWFNFPIFNIADSFGVYWRSVLDRSRDTISREIQSRTSGLIRSRYRYVV